MAISMVELPKSILQNAYAIRSRFEKVFSKEVRVELGWWNLDSILKEKILFKINL